MSQRQDVGLAVLESLSSRFVAALATIEERHWMMATPCAGWDLAALVDHVTGGNWFTSNVCHGQSADDALQATMERFGGSSVTSDRAASSFGEQLSAFGQPDTLDRTHHHVMGELSGRQILRLRVHDLIIHSWDIDQTLAPPATIPPYLVRWGLDELADEASLASKHFELAGTVMVAASTDAGTAYLERFGRRLPGGPALS